MNGKALTLAAGLIFVSGGAPIAQAGWSSSGGGLIGSAHNPWWIQNTSKVRFCFVHDASRFSAPLAQSRIMFLKALRYWQDEFQTAFDEGDSSTFQVATQAFEEVECDDSVDLKVQLGTLDQNQAPLLADQPSLIGIATRTEYDATNLRGRGFIYISPDLDPDTDARFDPVRRGRVVRDPFLIERPWSYGEGNLLYWIFAHELGHVFGIPHCGEERSLMNETFPELLLRKNEYLGLANTFSRNGLFERMPFFVFPHGSLGRLCLGCSEGWVDVKRFFGIEGEAQMLSFDLTVEGTLQVSLQRDLRDSAEILGEAPLAEHLGSVAVDSGSVRLWFDQRQKVFPDHTRPGVLAGPRRAALVDMAPYQSILPLDSQDRVLLLVRNPRTTDWGITIQGVVGGKTVGMLDSK